MTKTPAPYGPVPQSDFASQYARLCEAAGCKTQTALAVFLEVRQSSLSKAKRRQSLPSTWLVTLFEKKQSNPQWIRNGLGGKFLETTDAPGAKLPFYEAACRPVEDYSTDELLAEIVRRAARAMS